MCLIVIKPSDRIIPTALLTDAYQKNSDGWGLMWAEKSQIITVKGFDLEELIATVSEVQEDRELFLHMRMRTHGAINSDNLHPFIVTPDIALVHNGILNIEQATKQESDTAAFVRTIRPMLERNPELIFNEGWLMLAESFCTGSRLVFLHSSGRHSILHEKSGINWQGLWCSNTYAWTLWNDKLKAIASKAKTKTEVFAGHTYKSYNDDWRWNDDVFGIGADVVEEDDIADRYTLDYLRSLQFDELEEAIWDNPQIAVNAIWLS